MIVVSKWGRERGNKVCSGRQVFQQPSQKRKSLGYEILSEPNNFKMNPRRLQN
jgi:hypothetical protein